MSHEQQTYYNYLMKRSRFSFWIRRFFIADLTRHFHGQVLDVGCGIGEFLQQYNGDSLGIDINPLMVRHCHQQGFTCCVSGAYPLPFTEGSFDGVLASNILEHLDSVETAVAEAARVLKPGGVLAITVPQEAGFKHDDTHVNLLKQSDLAQIARRFNLQQKQSYFYPFRLEWPGKLLYFCELRAVFTKA
ncbi:MAG: class I SAM-dependent methyltransferase [Anaerolineaceae bacterium]|nr:class I SAM-dependent methyltransferase [Anaerolineaceae bacterium]